MTQVEELVSRIESVGGWLMLLPPDKVRIDVPADRRDLIETVRKNKPAVLEVLKQRGGWVGNADRMEAAATAWYWRTPSGTLTNVFPHCPACCSFALYRQDNDTFECLTCNLQNISEDIARRVQ